MLSIRKINPMVRAIGTMGAVVAIVGGVTFAKVTSNTVTITPNMLTAASAKLVIANGSSSACSSAVSTTATGITNNALSPGATTALNDFCIKNTGTQDLAVTAMVPQTGFTSGLNPNQVTLKLDCGVGATTNTTLDVYGTAQTLTTSPTTLAAGSTLTCHESATLASTYNGNSGQGGEVLPSFNVDFVGSQL